MALSMIHNRAAQRAANDYTHVAQDSQVRRARLASGLAIVKASDGSAQLGVSEGMRATIGGLTEGTRNAEQAVDLLRTAEGAMEQVSEALARMRQLAVQAATDTVNDTNREALAAEFDELKGFIDRVAGSAQYNGQPLLRGFGNVVDKTLSTAIANRTDTGLEYADISGAAAGVYTFTDDPTDGTLTLGNGVVTQSVALGPWVDDGTLAAGTTHVVNFDSLGISVELAGRGAHGATGWYQEGDLDQQTLVIDGSLGGSFQLGSRARPADRLDYDIQDMTTEGPVLDLGQVGVGTREAARLALARIDTSIDRAARERGAVGAVINRLDYTLGYTSSAIGSIQASESSVRDADMAMETSVLTRDQIMSEATMAVLAQSRVTTNLALQLLQ